MSVVIGLKYNNGVVLGADRQGTSGNIKTHTTKKIYKSIYSNTAWGGVGTLRDIDIISCNIEELMNYKDILDNAELDKRYVVNVIVVRFFNELMKYNRAYKVDNVVDIDSSFLVADSSSIFRIGNDGSVIEYDDYCAIGCGDQLVKGHLDALHLQELSEPEAVDLIHRLIKECCKDDIYIDDNIDIIVLKKGKKKDG